jgi:cell division protein FtsB
MAAAGRIRWDRVGRIALLCVLVGMAYLYVGPTLSWIETYKEAGERRAEVAALKVHNRELRQRRDQLKRPGTLEREARLRGMVRAGERAYVVQNLPR